MAEVPWRELGDPWISVCADGRWMEGTRALSEAGSNRTGVEAPGKVLEPGRGTEL